MLKWFSLLSVFCLIVILWITMDLFNKDKEIVYD